MKLFNYFSGEVQSRKDTLLVYRVELPFIDKLGGLPTSMTYIVGTPGSGKTTLAYQLAIEMYRLHKIPTVYLDTESSFSESRLKTIIKSSYGENSDLLNFHNYFSIQDALTYSDIMEAFGKISFLDSERRSKKLSIQEYFEKFYDEYKMMFVWDSVSSTASNIEALDVDNLAKGGMALKARQNSLLASNVFPYLDKYRIPYIVINHIGARIDNRYTESLSIANESFSIPGGFKLQFAAKHIIALTRSATIDEETWWVKVRVLKSKIITPTKFKMVFNTRSGFDAGINYFYLLLESKYITKDKRSYIISSEVLGSDIAKERYSKDKMINLLRQNIKEVSQFYAKIVNNFDDEDII